MMSDAETLIDEQLVAYNARDLTRFIATYSADVEVFRPPAMQPVITGSAALADFYASKRFCHEGLRAEIVKRLVVGDLVSDHERVYGLPGGSLEVIATYQVAEGRIRRVWLFSPSIG